MTGMRGLSAQECFYFKLEGQTLPWTEKDEDWGRGRQWVVFGVNISSLEIEGKDGNSQNVRLDRERASDMVFLSTHKTQDTTQQPNIIHPFALSCIKAIEKTLINCIVLLHFCMV